MRPLELRLRNFRSYFGDEAPLLTSATAASSASSVRSAAASRRCSMRISFALYGKTRRSAAATRGPHPPAGRSTAQWHLRFEVDGEVWEVATLAAAQGRQPACPLSVGCRRRPTRNTLETVLQEAEVNERLIDTPRARLRCLWPLRAACAGPVRRIPDGPARRTRQGAEGGVRSRSDRSHARPRQGPCG